MKKLIALLFIGLLSCKPETEFYLNGVPCYTKQTCVKDTSYYKYEWHYGYSFRGKFEYHYGGHSVYECIESKIDTLFIEK